MEKRLFVFAWNGHSKSPGTCYRGYFDGSAFVPYERGYCDSFVELYSYEYLEFFGDNGLQRYIALHSHPDKDLLQEMQQSFVYLYGKQQLELF